MNQQAEQEQAKALEAFGIDLTASARAGKLDPVIGRDSEIRRVSQLKSRSTREAITRQTWPPQDKALPNYRNP